MEYTRLPRTDLVVSRIAFGCEPLGGADWGHVDTNQAMAAVARAVELGVNFFDTADIYGLGRSESLLSEALGSRRHEVVIATKFGVGWRTGAVGERATTFIDCSPDRVVNALEASLRRLRVDCIPLYFVHKYDPRTPIEDTMEALVRCREAGKVRYVGVSNLPVSILESAHKVIGLSAVQSAYNLIQRQAEDEILARCVDLGLAFIGYGTLAQGLLTGKYGPGAKFGDDDRRHRLGHFRGEGLKHSLCVVERARQVGLRHGRSTAEIAIRWVLDNPTVSCAIVGAKTPLQIEQVCGSEGWRLSPQDAAFLRGGRQQLTTE